MKNKVLAFIYNPEKGQFLSLYSEPHPEHGEGGWFVVTGEVEKGENQEEAVAREVLEETGLEAIEILPLNWGSTYKWKGEECLEMNYLVFVKTGKITLNEEHSKHEWLDIKEFVERTKWNDDKRLLERVLTLAINKEIYFNKKERGE